MCGCLGIKSSKSPRKAKSNLNVKEDVCGHLYDDLRALDVKAIQILRITKDSILKESNKQLRLWIRNLNISCPDEYEYSVIKDYIEDEYTKYNT